MKAKRVQTTGEMSRRTLLKRLTAATGAVLFPYVIPAPALGRGGAVAPSEKIGLGVIGMGSRCAVVLDSMLGEPDVRCLAVCDVQAGRLASGKAMVDGRYGSTACATYRDFRELLARPDIDAVLIATGDRWHALASIMAARAGKDIYSEKPCGINMAECALIEETMRRCGRVYQGGTQRRSVVNFQRAVQLAQSGKLGRLRTLHASVYEPFINRDWLPAEPEPPRETLDWDRWLGPAPWRPFNHRYVNGRGWQGYEDFTAGANLMDWGAHTVDLCQWANQADTTGPVAFELAPDKLVGRYANGVILELNYERRVPQQSQLNLGTCPVRFVGDEGWVETGDTGEIAVHPASLKDALRLGKKSIGLDAGGHARNFFDCVRTRAATVTNPSVMKHSHNACFAAAMAWQLNRNLAFDPVHATFADADANRLRTRTMREPWCI
jgi:predicted dehydrogenase